MNSTKEAEREWHDAYYRAHARDEYPETLAEFLEKFKRVELTDFCDGGWNWWADARREILGGIGAVQGLRVLDYGCGYGTLGMYLSSCGAQVWAFDLSREAIQTAREAAAGYNLPAQFDQMDAEALRYEDEFFDLVVGFGVLHHVIKYPRAGAELRRLVKPGGRVIFHESLWNNPALNLVRRFTVTDAEAGDAHLTERNIREFCQGFSQVRLEKRHLVYMLKRLASLPERDLGATLRPRPLLRFLKSLDESLLRFKLLRRYCGEVIIYIEN